MATGKDNEETIKHSAIPRAIYKMRQISIEGGQEYMYYQKQSRHTLGPEDQLFDVPVFIANTLHESWKSPLRKAMEQLNSAAPGLHIHEIDSIEGSKICIQCPVPNEDRGKCYTKYIEKPIPLGGHAEISLANEWSHREGTALHELMHALGFEHEHQRADAENFVKCIAEVVPDGWMSQYEAKKDILGISRFDPHSIMMYPLDCALTRKEPEGDLVWETMTGDERCQVLSELDKVGLNIIYPPVLREGRYEPHIASPGSGLFYCGRPFGREDQDVNKYVGYNFCGPSYGANCPACRVLKSRKTIEICEKMKKWQGWSGLVYCKKEIGKDSSDNDIICGPDTGLPCGDCGKLLYPGYKYRK